MSEVDPVAMNVPVEPVMPPRTTAIRDAIQSMLPKDDNLVSDTKLHDGLVEISIRWRSLRWNITEAIAGRDADDIALKIDQDFRQWLRSTIKNMKDVPKHSRVAADMQRWLIANPDKREWLYGKETAAQAEGETKAEGEARGRSQEKAAP